MILNLLQLPVVLKFHSGVVIHSVRKKRKSDTAVTHLSNQSHRDNNARQEWAKAIAKYIHLAFRFKSLKSVFLKTKHTNNMPSNIQQPVSETAVRFKLFLGGLIF